MPSSFRHSLNAILFACGGWFLFCICDSISKKLVNTYGVFEILAFNGGVGVLITTSWLLAGQGWRGFITPKWKWYIVRSLSQLGSSFCAIKALSTIPMADFYGIVFLTPMLTTALAAVFLREKIGPWRIGALVIGFIGVLIIAGPHFSGHNLGYGLALLVALFSSLSAIFMRKIGQDAVLARYVVFPFSITALVYIPLCLFSGFKMPGSGFDLSLLMLFAPIAIIGVLGYSASLTRIREVAIVAPFHYSQMIWGALFGLVIFGDIPALSTLGGSLLIIVAGIIVIWREQVHHVLLASTAAETPI